MHGEKRAGQQRRNAIASQALRDLENDQDRGQMQRDLGRVGTGRVKAEQVKLKRIPTSLRGR